MGGRIGGNTLVVVVFLVTLVAYPRLAVLLGIVLALVWLVRLVSKSSNRYRTPAAGELVQQFENVRMMSGVQFEVFMANLFRAMGHGATILGGSGDQGVDILLTTNGQKIAVQCKNYAKPVGNKPVQEVFAGARHHGCQHAWVVAPAGYTRGAFELAISVSVSLFDANGIRAWIKEVDKLAAASKPPSTEGSAPSSAPASSSDSRIMSDRAAYDALLDKYKRLLESLHKVYRARREHADTYNSNPSIKEEWARKYDKLTAGIQETLARLDTLEGRNPDLVTDERVSRRAELASRHVVLENAESEEPSPESWVSPPAPSRNPLNPHADQDREQYDVLLNGYLSLVESLETYRDLRDLGQVPPGSDAEKQWRITLRMVNNAIRATLLDMDKLEKGNLVFTSDGRSQRRAEIAATHERIKREIGA